MKTISKLALLLAVTLGLTAGSASATTFNYQYTFANTSVINGSLDGVQNGDFVDNVSNVSVFFNGTAMSGSVFTAAYTGYSWINGPIVSFNALQNNFLFINDDIAGGGSGYDSFFYMLNSSVYYNETAAYSGSLNNFYAQESSVTGSWSLQAQGVPDGGLTAMMLGLSILGLASFRRKL